MSRINRQVKLSADGQSLITRVFWTDDEKEAIEAHLVKQFDERSLDYAHWIVTNRMLMIAQLSAIDEERYRETLNVSDVERMQERITEHVRKYEVDSVVSAHREYVATFRMTPILHAHELRRQVDALTTERDALAVETSELKTQNEYLTTEVERLTLELPSYVPPVAKLHTVGEECGVTVIGALPLAILIAAPRLAADAKSHFHKYLDDVIFVGVKDSPAQMKAKAAGRFAVVIEGQLSTDCMRAIREAASGYRVIRGGRSMLQNAVDEILEDHIKSAGKLFAAKTYETT